LYNRFTGSLNGANHMIEDLTINVSASYVGLFGYTSGAALSNIRLINVSIDAGAWSGSYNAGAPMVINNATLILNGPWYGGTGAKFILQSGAKIGGTGFLAWAGGDSTNLVITSGATITPGTSIGTIGCWNLEMEEGSMYDWEVDDGSFDSIDVRGGLKLPVSAVNSVTVNVSKLGSVQPGQTNFMAYVTDGISGDLDSIYMDYPPTLTGPEHPENLWGHLMVTGIIPEPATLGLLSLLSLAFLRRK